MRPAEFEEKDFEGPLYNQLLFGSNRLATPGQVFEGKFGIDSALEALHPRFWEAFGYRSVPHGVVLADFQWGWVWRRLGRERPLPNFAVNLLVQSKRPDRLNGINAKLARHGIKHGYWRFMIDDHQHVLIDRIAHTLRNRALVTYASTAFDTLQELYDYTEAGTIVEHSSFVKVRRMSGHSAWNFDSAGTRGVATSKPEPIDDPPLASEIDVAARLGTEEPSLETLETLNRLVVDTLRENVQTSPVAAFLVRRHEALGAMVSELGITKREIAPFVSLRNTFLQLNLDWFVIG